MNDKEYLLSQIKSLSDRCQGLLDTAAAGARDLTEDETTEFKSTMTRIEEHRIEVKKIEDREAMKAQLEALKVEPVAIQEPVVEVEAKTIGDALVRSPEYKAVIAEFKRTGNFPQFTMPPVMLKAAGDMMGLGTGNNQQAVQEGWDPTLYTPSLIQYPLRVRDLLSQVQASGNVTRYPVVTGRTAPTGNPTGEGVAKKGVEFTFDDGTATLEKNTAFGTASDELFADAPVLASYITNQIGLMVDQVEEASITTVLYAAASTVDGSTVHASSPNGFDAVRAAMNAIHISGGTPDGILIYPTDAALLDTLRSASSDEYYGGGPVGGPREMWWGGLRLVLSTAADPGRPLVGAFRAGATLYTRGGTTVETSNSHSDYFEKDKVAIRAYRRSVAVKHYPEFFVQCDIGAS